MSYKTINKPTALLIEVAEYAKRMRIFDSLKYKPGKTINSLTEEQRALLRTLTSDDIKDIGSPISYG
jgi:hypothetical protein